MARQIGTTKTIQAGQDRRASESAPIREDQQRKQRRRPRADATMFSGLTKISSRMPTVLVDRSKMLIGNGQIGRNAKSQKCTSTCAG